MLSVLGWTDIAIAGVCVCVRCCGSERHFVYYKQQCEVGTATNASSTEPGTQQAELWPETLCDANQTAFCARVCVNNPRLSPRNVNTHANIFIAPN